MTNKAMQSKRKSITKKLRFEVLKRDSFTCQYCGKAAPDVVLEIPYRYLHNTALYGIRLD
ncbi:MULTISPECIES: HNH endonuclease [Eikenella]|uniref:HNH endonuclease n=1 Tax=Eikenella TaxID=538 RepID=UPI0007DF025C|nr:MULTISPECIES: HNH endonuclease [Eikenella]OAM26482.1 hypothetical protein A7P94_07690 [Eikenella sp. NML01-A-086]OAM43779.1 hypothetical protein A7Q02_00040 [Eikenella sp. NML97-A-109]